MLTTQVKIANVSTVNPLLRSGKYYVKAKNGECANCPKGPTGCCEAQLPFGKQDFQMNFTSEEDVQALLDAIVLGVYAYKNADSITKSFRYNAYIQIRGRSYYGGEICVFWTRKGCRLEHGSRPEVCRWHRCQALQEVKEFNIKNKPKDRVTTSFTEEEVDTIIKVKGNLYRPSRMEEQEYERLDWDKILTILQGHS